jgi:predicted GIY-YIG superfamily endonuclease
MVKRRVWRHQRGSQNPYIEDEQTTQWSKEEFEDTKGVVRIFISKTNRQHNGQKEEFEDTKGVVRIRISKTNRQHNGQKKSLKTPKGQPESLYRRWTDNTMVKGRVWRHQRGSQNPYIEDDQTTQWSKEEFEDTKGIVRIFISKTNRQHNGQKKSLKTPKG